MLKSDAIDSGEEREEQHQQLPLAEKASRPREHSGKELAGSRWAGIILLFVTIVISLLFYLQGKLTKKDASALDATGSTNQGLFGTKTYRFEK
jgi:hypothetical protein